MALKARRTFTEEELKAGVLMICDPGGFMRGVMKGRLTIPETREDLPEAYRGKTVVTHEQRLMIYDGASYALWRWRYPKLAVGSKAILLRTSRKTGKTTILEARWAWWAVINPYGRPTDGLLHTPNTAHLAPLEGRLETMIWSSPLLALLFRSSNKSDNIWKWKNHLTFFHRIEGIAETKAGYSVVGLAVEYIGGDEGAFGRSEPYAQRKAVRLPGCVEVWGGVPRPGETGPFKEEVLKARALKKAGKKGEWSLHSQPEDGTWQEAVYDMRANPLYHSQSEFARQVAGAWDSEDTLTQVLGLDSEGGRTAFPVVPTAPVPFHKVVLQPSDVSSGAAAEIISSIGFNDIDADEWGIFCDYGFSPSPLEMVLCYKVAKIWYEHTRIEALRLDTQQAAYLTSVCDQNFPNLASKIVLDVHGQGRGFLDALSTHPDYKHLDYTSRVVPANFQTWMEDPRVLIHRKCKTPVVPNQEYDWLYRCTTCNVSDLRMGQPKPDGGWEGELEPIKTQAKELLTGDLIDALQVGHRFLQGEPIEDRGWGLILSSLDTELVEELRGTVALDRGGRSVIFMAPGNQNHMTDALRCLAQGERSYEPSLTQRRANWLDEAGWR